jgi:hypothetical protein
MRKEFKSRNGSRSAIGLWGEVAVLRDAEQGQGSREVKWDGSDSADRDLVAGVYFLRLEAGDETQTSKVMLLR